MSEDPFVQALREALAAPDVADPPAPQDRSFPPVDGATRPAVSPRRPTRPDAARGPASREPGVHPCPGCAKPVLDHLLACRGCWARLPRTLREAVVRGWSRDSLVAANAVVAAVAWWRGHSR